MAGMNGDIVLAFSGGLDTSFCVPYLQEQGWSVHTVFADTGGVDAAERAAIEQRAAELGVADRVRLDAATPPAVEGQPETPAQITERAQKEAIRRYPALGEKDSPENQLFIETFQELKHTGADDFFADPEWPLQLAELLAKRENWQRQ